MLAVTISQFCFKRAILLKSISFTISGKTVTVAAGTEILVDMERNIARVGKYHTDVIPAEYRPLFLN